MMPTITIIIPTFNSERYVAKCLNSVFFQTYKDFEVVVFDNKSLDGTLEIAGKYPVTLIKNKSNVGWARANNICITNSRSKYVFLLNVDTILHEDCIKKLFEFAESRDDFACISPALVEYSSFPERQSGAHPLVFDIDSGLIQAYDVRQEHVEVSFVPGTALFANRELLGEKLRFREDFFMYHEDVEFCLRILTQTPLKLFFLRTAVVAHDSKQSFLRFSTCRLALRNLFRCLIEYQDCTGFLSHYGSYAKNLFLMYTRFYDRHYPFWYPVCGAYYLFTSLVRLRFHNSVSLGRLYEINKVLARYPKQFEFIF